VHDFGGTKPSHTSVKDARRESFDFLGYTVGPRHFPNGGRWYLGAATSKKSVQRINASASALGGVRMILSCRDGEREHTCNIFPLNSPTPPLNFIVGSRSKRGGKGSDSVENS